MPGCERDVEAERDGAALLTYAITSMLPAEDPFLPTLVDEHGAIIVGDDDPPPVVVDRGTATEPIPDAYANTGLMGRKGPGQRS